MPVQADSTLQVKVHAQRESRGEGDGPNPTELGLITYVLDTSVLLSDPWALRKFDEHHIVLPLVVISELEGKRHHPELGWAARQALRFLEDLRLKNWAYQAPSVQFGPSNKPAVVNDHGGTLHIELNHIDQSRLPVGFRTEENDSRILACTLNLAAEGNRVVLVTKDMPLRVKAGAVGLAADEYHAQDVISSGYQGMVTVNVAGEDIDEIFDVGEVDLLGYQTTDEEDVSDIPLHCGVVMVAGSQSALGRVVGEGIVQSIPHSEQVFGIRGRSAEQRVALDLLLDDSVGIVSIGGSAGTGKSVLALCAGLDAVLERRQFKKVVVFRPIYAVGGQDLGYLPGSEQEKMNPWAQAVFDTLEGVVRDAVLYKVEHEDLLEVLPLTHIRGRSLHDSFVIVDEAQSLERNVLLTVLSRLGRNSRVVLTHDVAQRDNLRVGRHDGVQAVIEKLKGHELFGHVILVRSERSPVAELVTSLLEER